MWQKQETLILIEKKPVRVISHLFRRCRKWAQVSHNERATVKTRKKNSEREEET